MAKASTKTQAKNETLPPEPRFRTQAEEEILRVLWAQRDGKKGLVRSQVHKKMALPPRERPTTARIGQILRALHHHGFLDEELDRFQGKAKAAFFRLNEKGKKACQEHYNFGEQDRVFFRTTDDMRKKYLTARYFDGTPDAPIRRILGFYAYRGGLGQSSLVAHTANGLAQEAPRKNILVVDFDTNSPGLDPFFDPEGEAGRGLRGLIFDYFSQPDWGKESWLRTVIEDDAYFVRPRAEAAPNLYYLSSGMGETGDEEASLERAIALEHLRSEVGASAEGAGGSTSSLQFLPAFREALLERFNLVLLDSHAGRNMTVLVLSELADELIVSVRPSESPQSLDGLRSVLAWHFRKQEEIERAHAGLLLVIHLSGYGGRFDGLGWVRDQLLADGDLGSMTSHRVWPFRHHTRLQKNATDWKLTPAYAPLVKRLLGVHSDDLYLPPEQVALAKVLDPRAPYLDRSMWAGGLHSTTLTNFAHHLDALYERDPSLFQTDATGRGLLEELFDDYRERVLGRLEV